MRVALLAVLALLIAVDAGCGGGGEKASTKTGSAAQTPSLPPALAARLRDAEHPRARDFPTPGGRSLQALAGTIKSGPQVGLAASVLVRGRNRLAFGLIGADKRFIYGRSALYIARSPKDPAQGPFLAPADSLVPAKPFLIKGAAQDTADIKAIYSTQVSFKRPGGYSVLALSRVGGRLVGAASQVKVTAGSPIPNVGERPPIISTDTVAAAGGDLDKIAIPGSLTTTCTRSTCAM